MFSSSKRFFLPLKYLSIPGNSRTMSSKPSILIVGLPVDPSAPPIKVPWSETPVSIHDELKQFESKMRERGYDDQTFVLGR